MLTAFALAFLVIQAPRSALAGPGSKESVDLAAKLGGVVEKYTLNADNFLSALAKVSSEFKIPMGIEWVRTPSAMTIVNISLKGATVQGVILALVGTQPAYEVQINNAVVHVRPRGLVPDRENFLKLKVRQFETRDEVVEIAEKRLRKFVMATVSPPAPAQRGVRRGGTGFSQGVEVGDPEITLDLRDVSVEDVLDALSLASERKTWVVTFDAAGRLTPTGFRRAVSLWNSSPIPDSDQPIWDMFAWGRYPPISSVEPQQRIRSARE